MFGYLIDVRFSIGYLSEGGWSALNFMWVGIRDSHTRTFSSSPHDHHFTESPDRGAHGWKCFSEVMKILTILQS